MKILYVYKDYMGRRKLYGSEMSKLGHEVIYLKAEKKEANQFTPKCIKKTSPELLWLLNPFYVLNNMETIDYARSKNIPIVMYATYNPQVPYTDWLHIWNKIDFLFVHNLEFYRYLKKQGLNSYYMPIGFYPKMYSRCVKKKILDITFCGGVRTTVNYKTDMRCVCLQSLQKLGIIVYGGSLKNKLFGIKVHAYNTHNKQKSVYAMTKVNLDLPFFSPGHSFYNNGPHIKNRFFEIPATGNFMLTVRCEEFENIFEDTVGYYNFGDPDSLLEEAKRYIKDKKTRVEMANKAYKLVHEKHTFRHRFKQMFKILKNSL